MTTFKLAVHPAEFWAATDTIAKIHKRKLCLAASRGDCDGPIVEAHTIPHSQLEEIAVEGHVNHVLYTPGDLLANDGHFAAGKRGIGRFSVLNFFCAKHDRELFSHIENDALDFDQKQAALLHYRAMAAELYKKMNAVDGSRHHIERLKRRRDLKKLEFAKAFEAGNLLGLRDMARTFSQCEKALAAENYDLIRGLVIRFKKMPTIMTVGGFSPEFDYNGTCLQILGRPESTYEQIGVSVLASRGAAVVALTWLSGATACETFAQSLLRQPSNYLTTLTIQTAFEHLENTCMNIDWWSSLLPIERKTLLDRMQFGGSPVHARTSRCLQIAESPSINGTTIHIA